ncbi:MAG: SseB family protein [Acetatifactor sp.]
MSDINLLKDLFLCPVVYDDDPCEMNGKPLPLLDEDTEIHFSSKAADMYKLGSKIFMLDAFPETLQPAKEARKGILHLRKIDSPDGHSYIPLFISYKSMINIFGRNIHVGIVSFEDAISLCSNETDVEGIVVGPGHINKIIHREALGKM